MTFFFFLSISREDVHIGMADGMAESVMRWTNGRVTTFIDWRPGQPNGGTGQNCMTSESSGWEDCGCNTRERQPFCQLGVSDGKNRNTE